MPTKRRIRIIRKAVSYGAGEVKKQITPVIRCLWCFTPKEPRPNTPIKKIPCQRCGHYGTTTRTELETRGVGIEEFDEADEKIEELQW